MASRKRPVNGATFKARPSELLGAHPSTGQQSAAYHQRHRLLASGSNPNVQPSQRHEDQLLQMLASMKEQMKEQRSNQIATGSRWLSTARMHREQEALRWLNNERQTQIVALQNNQLSTQSESEPKVGGSPNL